MVRNWLVRRSTFGGQMTKSKMFALFAHDKYFILINVVEFTLLFFIFCSRLWEKFRHCFAIVWSLLNFNHLNSYITLSLMLIDSMCKHVLQILHFCLDMYSLWHTFPPIDQDILIIVGWQCNIFIAGYVAHAWLSYSHTILDIE